MIIRKSVLIKLFFLSERHICFSPIVTPWLNKLKDQNGAL